MTIKECETRIEDVKQRIFHIDFDVDVFLLGKASIETKESGVRTKSWTDYVKKPNLCLYLRGLKPPKDSLIRLWLYQWI